MHHVHWPSDLCDCVSTTLHTFPYSPLCFWNSKFCLQDFPLLVPAPFLSPAPLHGINSTFLSDRNSVWTRSSQTLRLFVFKDNRPVIFSDPRCCLPPTQMPDCFLRWLYTKFCIIKIIVCVTAWAVERHAAWRPEWLKGSVTSWAVDRQRDCVSSMRVKGFIQNPPVLALPHRFSCKPNMAASPLAFHAETYLWHSETAHVGGTASSSLSNHRKKIQYPKRKEKCLAVITWYDTSERVVTCCQYRWYHTTRVKELWRVVGTDDITSHVWKSCDVLLALMISHHTSEKVVTCC